MIQTSCISDDHLRGLLLGELSVEDAAPLEGHLLECPVCVARTRSLSSSDTLVVALQQARNSELPAGQSSSIDRLVQRLSDRSQLGTHSSLLDATVAPGSKESPNVQDLIALLEPAAGPNELGRLGSFRVLKLLGQGGMGAVFLAEDTQLRRHVALKLLKPRRSGHSDSVERFMREARAAAAVRHDHVVTIYQVGEAHGVPFIAQELLEGETLEDRLRRDVKLPIAESLRIAREIASGLAAAHHRGLLHRDVKPSNIWLEQASGVRKHPGSSPSPIGLDTHREADASRSPHGRVKILDFGLARSQQGDEQLTQAGIIVGTPAYMSPEQASSQPLDARSDLFSLGGVLYRMVTGRLPFQGTDTLSMLRSLAVDEPPPARSLNAEIPAELSDLIAELLAKDVKNRPQSADDVARTLASIENELASPAAGSKPASGGVAVGRAADRGESASVSKKPWFAPRPTATRPQRLLIALGAAAGLIACAAVIITITRPDGSKTQIKVDGESKVEVVIDNSKPKADVEGRTDQAKSVMDNRGTLREPQPPIATPKPTYETDFSASDPNWLSNPTVGTSSIRNGQLALQSNEGTRSRTWLRGAISVPYMAEADIEVVGRATDGMWGLWVINDRGVGIVLDVDMHGQVSARRYEAAADAKSFKLYALPISRLPTRPSRDGEFDVLRVAWRDRSVDVWFNGEPAFETVKVDTQVGFAKNVGLAMIGLVARPVPDGTSFDCEFDSLRIWRAGEAPPPNAAAKPIYENDFSTPDPIWNARGENYWAEIGDGHLSMHMQLASGSPFFARGKNIPMIDQADIEVSGRATAGVWGVRVMNEQQPRSPGVSVEVGAHGEITAHQYDTPPGQKMSLHPLSIRGLPTNFHADGEFNTLRVAWRDRSLALWLNGEKACDDIPIVQPLGTAAIELFAYGGGKALFDCEYDSLRIWRAGEAPPLPNATDRATDQTTVTSKTPQSADKERVPAEPDYENDFSDPSVHRQTAEDKALGNGIKNGLLIIHWPTIGTRSLSVSYPMTSADFEIVGRATKGLWGFKIAKPQTPIKFWLQFDQQGKLKTGFIDRALDISDLPLVPVVQKPVATWKGDGAFNTLRGTVRDGLVRVWINGEEACEPIKLPDQFPWLQIFVAASATDDQGVYAEFDSVRVWRAGEGPPLPEKATPRKDHSE